MKFFYLIASLLFPEVQAFLTYQPPRNIISKSLQLCAAGTKNSNRKPLILGNWKSNPRTIQEAINIATGIAAAITSESPCDVAIFVPFPFIESIENVVGDKLIVGAEAVIPQKTGAFTAGVSPTMLKSMDVHWCLAGHFERRAFYNEDDGNINSQVKLLIETEMNVVLCIGESAEEFENQLARAICEVQLRKGLAGVSAEQMKSVTIAYQPVWAIGTGKTAKPELAQSVIRHCRDILSDMYGSDVADSTRIVYGGSVGPEAIDGLMAQPDIDGALVGTASLQAESFGRIINFVPSKEAEFA